MTRAIALAAALLLAFAAPAESARSVLDKATAPILGTIPGYPGAARPLPSFETGRLAIATTRDKPDLVITYYLHTMPRAGWKPEPGIAAEAFAAATAGQPAWLTFTRAGLGRLDVQVTTGSHPTTAEPLTVIFYERPAVKP